MPASPAAAQPNVLAPFFTWKHGAYLWSIAVAIGSYVTLMLDWVAHWFFQLPPVTEFVQVLTVICCVGMAAHVVTMLLIMRSNDEFIRSLTGKRVTIAAFATFGLLTIWGLLENIGWAPPFTLMFAYALFLLVHTLLVPFINADRP